MSERPPLAAGGRLAQPEPPARFYRKAEAAPDEGGYALMLDGRRARTPAHRPMSVASNLVARALAEEWSAQIGQLEPESMPLTRIVNAAIDRVADEMPAVRKEVVNYAAGDLLCYRAGEPNGLVERQNEQWNPILAWAEETFGARMCLAEGVMYVSQPPEALAAIDNAIEQFEAVRLAALYTATTLTGSAILALAVAYGRLSSGEAWAAAHVDEDWQMEQWGGDDIAVARRSAQLREMRAAGLVLSAGRNGA